MAWHAVYTQKRVGGGIYAGLQNPLKNNLYFGPRCIPSGCRCKISVYPDIPAILRLVGRVPQRPQLPTYFFASPQDSPQNNVTFAPSFCIEREKHPQSPVSTRQKLPPAPSRSVSTYAICLIKNIDIKWLSKCAFLARILLQADYPRLKKGYG
ncbi:MAG: hypothetical protein WBM78_27630 [Desulfobacterales bacterium]